MLYFFRLYAINPVSFQPQAVFCGLWLGAQSIVQYGTWAMVYTVVLFSKPLLCWFVLILHMLWGGAWDFTHKLKGYLSLLPSMPDFPRFSDPDNPLFLVFWLVWWLLAFLYHHIFLYWICLEQINMRKGGNMFGAQKAPFPVITFKMKRLFSCGNSIAKTKGVKPHDWGLPKARLIL